MILIGIAGIHIMEMLENCLEKYVRLHIHLIRGSNEIKNNGAVYIPRTFQEQHCVFALTVAVLYLELPLPSHTGEVERGQIATKIWNIELVS